MAEAMSVSSEEEIIEDLTSDDVTTKYKAASEIVNKTIAGILSWAKPGQKAIDLCVFGDTLITQQCSAIFKSKNIDKGIAFPTCVSVNECVCHYSPLVSEGNKVVLQAGDVVKIDLGAHIDGYVAVAAHTFVLRAEGDSAPITGKNADVIKAAYVAADACLKTIRPGATNAEVTKVIEKVAQDFGVKPVQGVLMHQMKRFIIDGNNVIINKEDVDQKVEVFEFEKGQVYTIDVVMSTGEGKPIQRDARTTVYKRAVDQNYLLKMKASRATLSQINSKHPTLPFTLRELDEKTARMGIVECVKHDLVTGYPVLYEKAGEQVAHFKFTVLMLPSNTNKATGGPFNIDEFQSEKVISEEIQEILSRSTKYKK